MGVEACAEEQGKEDGGPEEEGGDPETGWAFGLYGLGGFGVQERRQAWATFSWRVTK